jgi:hypothetical protein
VTAATGAGGLLEISKQENFPPQLPYDPAMDIANDVFAVTFNQPMPLTSAFPEFSPESLCYLFAGRRRSERIIATRDDKQRTTQ